MENRAQSLLNSLIRFYEKKQNYDILIDTINSKHGISLRMIDWLVTNYSKYNKISYVVNGNEFIIHQSYKNMLKAYSKRLFDPFRRHERINLHFNKTQIETTVAQLTFFKWAIENNILEYATKNKEDIKSHMDKYTQKLRQKKKINKMI